MVQEAEARGTLVGALGLGGGIPGVGGRWSLPFLGWSEGLT